MDKLTIAQLDMILDALAMAVKSNQRMHVAKPQYGEVISRILADLREVESIVLKARNATKK